MDVGNLHAVDGRQNLVLARGKRMRVITNSRRGVTYISPRRCTASRLNDETPQSTPTWAELRVIIIPLCML